ncbi:MAG: hypothetical protein ACPGWR_03500 [Ardenticatenaceae bacterium]
MLTEAVITVLTETVFSHLIEEGGVSEKVRGWLGRDPQRLAFQVALTRTCTRFAQHHPQWAAAFFDEHFLKSRAAPLLARCLTRAGSPDASELAEAWADQMSLSDSKRQARIAELTPVASDFLHWLDEALRQRPEFQPLFDSRAQDVMAEATMQTANATKQTAQVMEQLRVELIHALAALFAQQSHFLTQVQAQLDHRAQNEPTPPALPANLSTTRPSESQKAPKMNLRAVRRQLNDLFDDTELDIFCMENFSRVYDRFSRGLRRDEKITLLLDYCRRNPKRWQKLLTLLEEVE